MDGSHHWLPTVLQSLHHCLTSSRYLLQLEGGEGGWREGGRGRERDEEEEEALLQIHVRENARVGFCCLRLFVIVYKLVISVMMKTCQSTYIHHCTKFGGKSTQRT